MCIPQGLRTGLTEVPLRNLGSLFQRDVNLKLNQNRHLLGYVVDQVMSPARPAWACLSSVCHPRHHMGIRAEGPAAWGLLCLWKPGQVKPGSLAQWPSRQFSGTQNTATPGRAETCCPRPLCQAGGPRAQLGVTLVCYKGAGYGFHKARLTCLAVLMPRTAHDLSCMNSLKLPGCLSPSFRIWWPRLPTASQPHACPRIHTGEAKKHHPSSFCPPACPGLDPGSATCQVSFLSAEP